MILYCNYEELTALRQGAQAFLEEGLWTESAVVAPSEVRESVESLLPRLDGDLSIEDLADQRRVATTLEVIVEALRVEMELRVTTTHPAHESAVTAYFDYAHALAVLSRVLEMGLEMEALIELVTGNPPSDDVACTFQFPD